MNITTFGIMRGGIHIMHSWIISKFPNDSVVYYNNIRNINSLDDRLIKRQDTRVGPIRDKLTTPENRPLLTLKSFESKSFDMHTDNSRCILVIRNPYNNLASSIAYCENNGQCKDIICDYSFIDLWKYFAREALGITKYLNKTIIVYDLFIKDPEYRKRKAQELNLPLEPNILNTLYMGGGSSFTTNNYLDRHVTYSEHQTMKMLFEDPQITEYWTQIISLESDLDSYQMDRLK